jgi:hypothetical protein
MHHSSLILGALLALALAQPTLAQPTPARPALSNGEIALSAQPAPDAAPRLQLARQLYDLSGGRPAAEAQVRAMFATANKIVAANLPPDAARFGQALQRDMEDELIGIVPALIDNGVHAYADNLTAKELRDYIAWLSSDSGKAVIQKAPAVRQELLDRSAPMIAAMMPALQHKVATRVCEQLHCTPRERETVAGVMAKALPAPRS